MHETATDGACAAECFGQACGKGKPRPEQEHVARGGAVSKGRVSKWARVGALGYSLLWKLRREGRSTVDL